MKKPRKTTKGTGNKRNNTTTNEIEGEMRENL